MEPKCAVFDEEVPSSVATKQAKIQALEAKIAAIDHPNFVPTLKTGKPKTPNQVRLSVRKYCDKENITIEQFRDKCGVSAESWVTFMNERYKDTWAGCQSTAYWSAARFLAKVEIEAKLASLRAPKPRRTALKRDVPEAEKLGPKELASKRAKLKVEKEEFRLSLDRITSVDIPFYCPIYDNCDEVRHKIDVYLAEPGVVKAQWLRAIDMESGSLTAFRKESGKGSGAANICYLKAYRFFEQQRILANQPKSVRRLEQEARWGTHGFPRVHDDGRRLVCTGTTTEQVVHDIELIKDIRNAQGLL